MMLREAHRKRAQPTQCQKHVVRSGADAEQLDAVADERPRLCIGCNSAEHDVGMPADIFGRRLNADIDALAPASGETAASPRYCRRSPEHRVACAAAAMVGMSGISNDCEPGASTITALVFGLNSSAMPAPDQRIVIGCLNSVPGKHSVAEISCGPVNVIADEDMIACLQHRQQCRRNRRQAPTAPVPHRRIAVLPVFSAHLATRGWSACHAAHTDIRRDARADLPRSGKAR